MRFSGSWDNRRSEDWLPSERSPLVHAARNVQGAVESRAARQRARLEILAIQVERPNESRVPRAAVDWVLHA